jgi:uncharacterized protein with HEPN domain
MKRDYRLYLDDILEAIGKIEEYTADIDVGHFRKDSKTLDAVMRNFAIIGEAAKHIPERIRKKYTTIPWKQMAGMRDKLMHEYFGIKVEVVWETITRRLPEVKRSIKSVLDELERKME